MALLLHQGEDVGARDERGLTALMCAVVNGQADAVEFLLGQQGIDIACVSNAGYSALYFALKGYFANEHDEAHRGVYQNILTHLQKAGIGAVIDPLAQALLQEKDITLDDLAPASGSFVMK